MHETAMKILKIPRMNQVDIQPGEESKVKAHIQGTLKVLP